MNTLTSFVIWVISMSAFAVTVTLSQNYSQRPDLELIAIMAAFLIGIVSWGIFVRRIDKSIRKKFKKQIAFLLSIFSLCISFIGGIAFVLILLIVLFRSTSKSTVPENKIAGYTLISNELKKGAFGNEVKIVQSALSQDKTLYLAGIVSGYYGDLTQNAVINFQRKYAINQTGELDKTTLNKFNEIYGTKPENYYLSPEPTIFPTASPDKSPYSDNSGPWGVAEQISEHTWSMKIGDDNRMATPDEIYTALNNYRKDKGRNQLRWDNRLAKYAQTRAQYFTSLGKLDEHAGFSDYVQNPDNLKTLGFWGVGENSSYGYRLSGVHLIEWIFAGDKPHDDNQLDPGWTDVGVGVDGIQTDIIFGKFTN